LELPFFPGVGIWVGLFCARVWQPRKPVFVDLLKMVACGILLIFCQQRVAAWDSAVFGAGLTRVPLPPLGLCRLDQFSSFA